MACKLFTWYTGSHCQLFSNALGCLEQMELIPLSPEPCFLEALREGQPEVLQLITQAGSLGDGCRLTFCLTAPLLDTVVAHWGSN